MRRFKFSSLFLLTALGVLLHGCCAPQRASKTEKATADARVDFTDPVLNSRKILLFGEIDEQAGAVTIQKLLFLDGKGHEPIDLFLQTPGGDMMYAFAIERTMRLLKSPVNTYALSECNSGGAVLLAAGTGKRRAFRGAVVIVHGLKVSGTPPPHLVELLQEAYTDFWRKHTRLPESRLPVPLGGMLVLSAEQALQYGVVDEVVDR